jgi:pimeloyl-ACP methyl ester carboxylesterase
VKVNGLSFHVEEEGQGPPLLLISGLGYSSWCWQELSAALRDQFRVIRFDNRGTGRSDKPDGPYSIPQLAEDAAAVLDACHAPAAHVLGHSMGGYIALTLALAHPQTVRSLVLASTSPGGTDTEPMPQATVETWRLAATLTPQDYARRGMPKSFAPGWTEQHPDQFEAFLARRLQFPTPMACWTAQYAACAEYVARGVDARRIGQPALVMHGSADGVVPFANGRLLSQKLPHAEWSPFDGVGHLPLLEQPAAFAERARNFLSKVTP